MRSSEQDAMRFVKAKVHFRARDKGPGTMCFLDVMCFPGAMYFPGNMCFPDFMCLL